MMFLPTVLVLVVCSIHLSTAAPTPRAPTMNHNLKIRDDVRTVLRELLINRGQTTLDQWLGLTGESDKEQDSTASQDHDDEQFSTQATLTITSLPPPPPPSPPKPPIHPICKKRLNNPNRIKDIRDIQTRRDVIEYLIYRLCIPTITAEDVLAVSLIVDRLNNRPIIGLPNPFEPELQTSAPEIQTLVFDIDFMQGDQEVVTPPDSDNVNDQESDNKDLVRKRTDGDDFDEGDDQATSAPALQPVQILHPLCMNLLNNPNQIKTIGEVQNRHDAIEYLIYRLCLPGVTAEDIEEVADIVGGLSWPVGFMPRDIYGTDIESRGQAETTTSYNVRAQNYEAKSSTLNKQNVYKYTSDEEEEKRVDMELMIRHLLGELIN
nr:uncharacterized protein LOC129278164 [Lytechinus pictus]